jgi:pimeloyl-ACP methyl ester carboxylesterase
MAKGKTSWSAAQQSRVTDIGGLRLHDRGAGHGPPVVLVHGLGSSSRSFIPLLTALAPFYDGRAVDLPGHGVSESPQAVLDIPGLADALAGWVEAAGLHGAAVVGTSTGCQVVADCAARHPQLLGPVVLISPTVDPAARGAVRQLVRFARTGLRADITQAPLLLGDAARAGWRRVARTYWHLRDDRIESKLADISQPTLIIRGSADPVVPRRWAEQASAMLPDGRWESVAGGAHAVHYTLPQAVGLLIRGFLDDIGWPAS